MDEQSKPLPGTLTLDEAWNKWGHISDVRLYTGVDEQKHEPYAGFYRLGRRGTTDEDLLNFLAETEHLPTWKRGFPGEDARPDRRLAPGNRERLEKGRSPFSCAETIALALRSGAPVERGSSLEDFRIGQEALAEARAEALARKAAAAVEQESAKKEAVKKPARKGTESLAKASLSKSKFGPTDEQAAAIAAFGQGGSLKIIAGAGTGKTTTLKMAGESTSRRGVYIAFNTAMADDAKRRMPKNVAASTAHSMAFRAVDPGFRSKIGSRLPASMAAEAGGVRSMIELPGKNKDGAQLVISQATAGYLMLDWVRRHCMGADAQITQDSAPVARMLDIMGIAREDATPGDWKQARDIAGALLPATEKLWGRMSNPRDAFPASHDTYLKVWATSNPRIDADFILFDEAQDANALMLQIVGAQSAQKVYVGDPNQQIYAWRGAVNAMQSIQTDHETRLTESFRFGPEIAEFANRALALCGSDMRLTGKAPPGRDFSRDGKPMSATICRTNASVIQALVDAPDISRAHIVGGTAQIVGLLRGMGDLRDRNSTSNPELCHFKGWGELCAHAESETDDLSSLFKLTESGQRIEPLIGMLEKTAIVARPDSHVISTGHKCKGLEWSDVDLAGDFRTPAHARWSAEEANLLYVAGTRGMRSLVLDGALAAGLESKPSYRETTQPQREPESDRAKKQPSRARVAEEMGVGL